MASSAQLTLTGKEFGRNGAPGAVDAAGKLTLKKKALKDTTFTLSLSDATLKEQVRRQGSRRCCCCCS